MSVMVNSKLGDAKILAIMESPSRESVPQITVLGKKFSRID